MLRSDFTRDVLAKIGAPNTATRINFGIAWAAAENTSAENNPWATTEPWPNASEFNSAGVKNYASYEDGVNATVATLTNGDYAHLLTVLRTPESSVIDMIRALDGSPWGSHVTSLLYEDVSNSYAKYNKEVPGSVTTPEPTPTPAPTTKPSDEANVKSWITWMTTQLQGMGYSAPDATIALTQYVDGEVITNDALAGNIASMVFSTGANDPRYVPPVKPVPEVKKSDGSVITQADEVAASSATHVEMTKELPVLKVGSTGRAVLLASVWLAYDNNAFTPTSHFNAEMESAVKEYQHKWGLKEDGIIGPQTWASFFI